MFGEGREGLGFFDGCSGAGGAEEVLFVVVGVVGHLKF